MLGAGLHTLPFQRPDAPRGQRDLTSSPCRSPIRAPSARLHPAGWQDTGPGACPSPRARPPQGRAPERRGPARRAGSGREDPGLSGWAGRRAFFPQRAGGAGRGAGRGAGPGGARGGARAAAAASSDQCSRCPAVQSRPERRREHAPGPARARTPRRGLLSRAGAARPWRTRRPAAATRGPEVSARRGVLGCGGAGRGGRGRARPGAPQPHRGSRESRRPRARLPQPPSLLGSGSTAAGPGVRRGRGELEGGPPVTCSAPRWGADTAARTAAPSRTPRCPRCGMSLPAGPSARLEEHRLPCPSPECSAGDALAGHLNGRPRVIRCPRPLIFVIQRGEGGNQRESEIWTCSLTPPRPGAARSECGL